MTTFLFSRFQRGLKPWFGEAVLFAVVCIVAFANFTFVTFCVFMENIERNVTFFAAVAGFFTAAVIAVVTGFTFDVAFFTAGFFTATVIAVVTGFAFDVAFFTAGFFTATVLGAIG
jgi:hypothetical protein